MVDTFSLGKDGKFGNIDFSKLKSGLTKKELGIEEGSILASIFDSIDENREGDSKGKLDRQELNKFIQIIKNLAGDDNNLSEKEAKGYDIDGTGHNKNQKELLSFLNKLSSLTKNVKNLQVNDKSEVITYDDGHTEELFTNGTKVITTIKNGKTVKEVRDSKNNITSESEISDEEETIIEYKDQKPNKKSILNKKTNILEEYDLTKNPAVLVKRTNKNTNEVTTWDNGKEKIVKESGTQKSTTIKSDDDNYTTVTTENDRKISQKKVINGKEYNVKYDGNGNTIIVVQANEKSIKDLAQKFNCKPELLIKLNANKVKGNYPNAYFEVGEEIKIPSELEADNALLEGRMSSEDAKRQQAEQTRLEQERRAAAARRSAAEKARANANGEYAWKGKENEDWVYIKVKYAKGSTAEGIARDLYKREGITNPSQQSIRERANAIIKAFPDKFDKSGKIKNEELLNYRVAKNIKGNVIAKGNNGYYVIKDENGSLHFFNSARKEIKDVEFKKICPSIYAQVTGTSTGTKPISAGEKQIQKQKAKAIVDELKDAISGWNDHDAITRALNRIKKGDTEVLNEVNRLLAAEGYKSDNMYSSIEKFLREEMQRVATDYTCDELESFVQKWIDEGVLQGNAAINAQARMAARVIIDAGDGFGTDVEKTKKGIRLIKAPAGQDKASAKKVLDQVNKIIASHKTFYGIGTKANGLIDYLDGEVCQDEIKYLKGILGENDAVQGEEKAQVVRDLVEEAVSGAGTDIEYLEQALKAVKTPEERKAVEEKLDEYCKKKGIKRQIKGQSALQAIMYDECDTFMGIHKDHKEIRKFNEMMIQQGAYGDENSDAVIKLRAEQAVLQILEGDLSNILDAVQQIKDPKVYAKVNSMLQNNLFKGKYANLEDYLNKKFGVNSTNSDLVLAELAGNNLIGDEKSADVAFRLLQNSDFNNRAKGFMAIRSEKTAKIVDAKLKQIGTSLAKEYEKFNKEKDEYKTKSAIWDKLAFVLGDIAEHISDEYRKNTDSSSNIYIESNTTTPVSAEQKATYDMTIRVLEQGLKQMKADYQAALDEQGIVSGAINAFCSRYNIGMTRDEIEARIEHDTETIRLLKLAAAGKLAKMENGKTVAVTFEDVFKERQAVNITGNASFSKTKEVKEFDPTAVEKVSKQAERLGAMSCVKDLVAVCWDELDSASKSNDKKYLASAIFDTLKQLSQLTGKNLSLGDYGYSLNNNGIIVDSKGNEVPVDKLKEIVAKLKQGLADIASEVLGAKISANSSYDDVTDALDDAYEQKIESFKQEYRDAFNQEPTDEMVKDYISTINTGKTILNFGTMIGAAILAPFTGGGSLAVFLAVAGSSMLLNAAEKSTDANGYTNMEWTSDAEQALWDGALAAAGMKIGQYAELFAKGGLELKLAQQLLSKNKAILSKMISNPQTLEKATICVARVEAMGFEVSSDTLQSLVQMYCQEGHFDEESFVQGLIMSVAGNAAGHIAGARGDLKDAGGGATPKADESKGHTATPESKPNEPKTEPKVEPKADDPVVEPPKTPDTKPKQGETKTEPQRSEEKLYHKSSEEPKVDEPKAEPGNTAPEPPKGSEPKPYSEMNENELFAEYQRLHQETSSANVDNKTKVANINKMKEITKELEAKGYKIENGELKTNTPSSPTLSKRVGKDSNVADNNYRSAHDTGLFDSNNAIEPFSFGDVGKGGSLSDYIRNNLGKKFEVLSYSEDYIKVQGKGADGKIYNFILSNDSGVDMPVLAEVIDPKYKKAIDYKVINDDKSKSFNGARDVYESYNQRIATNKHNNLSIEKAIENIKDKPLQDLAVSIRNQLLQTKQGELLAKFDNLVNSMAHLENAADELAYKKILENLQEINSKISMPEHALSVEILINDTQEYIDIINTSNGRYTVARERSTQRLDAMKDKKIQDVVNHNKIAEHIGMDYTVVDKSNDFVKVKVKEKNGECEYIFTAEGEPCVRKRTLTQPYKKDIYSAYDPNKKKWVQVAEGDYKLIEERLETSKKNPVNRREWHDYDRADMDAFNENYNYDKQFETLKTKFEKEKHMSKAEKISMYKEYYLSKIHDDLKIKCDKAGVDVSIIENSLINMIEKYNVPVFLDKNALPEDVLLINIELERWHVASNGKATLPPMIDTSKLDVEFFRSNYTLDFGGADGYCFSVNKRISLNGSGGTGKAFRHELTHANDQIPDAWGKFGKDGHIDISENNKAFMEKTWYREELERAGVRNIDYAYTNKREFIATAAEGDFSKYSPEFKQVLVDLGMPEWMFKLDEVEVKLDLNSKPVITQPKSQPKQTTPTTPEPVTNPQSKQAAPTEPVAKQNEPTHKTNSGSAASETPSQPAGRFGTPENPNYGEFYNPTLTEQELLEALEFIEKMPDDNTMKNRLKSNIESRLQKIRQTKTTGDNSTSPNEQPRVSEPKNDIDEAIINNPTYKKYNTQIQNARNTQSLKNIELDINMIEDDTIRKSLLQLVEKKKEEIWTLAANTNRSGFARVKDAKTNVQNLTEQDVFFCGRTQNGANFVDISQNSKFTSAPRLAKNGRTLIEQADISGYLTSGPRITSYYSEKLNMTGIQIDVPVGRGSNFCIYFKGQVSEADAKRLAQHIESIRLNPNDPNSPKLIPDNPNAVSSKEWEQIAQRVQEEVVAFFNNL